MQLHSAENCRSNLLCKNALNDESKSVFSGMIKVMPNAANTNSYQTNRNLLLSNTSEADSLPGLEILANEVNAVTVQLHQKLTIKNSFTFFPEEFQKNLPKI